MPAHGDDAAREQRIEAAVPVDPLPVQGDQKDHAGNGFDLGGAGELPQNGGGVFADHDPDDRPDHDAYVHEDLLLPLGGVFPELAVNVVVQSGDDAQQGGRGGGEGGRQHGHTDQHIAGGVEGLGNIEKHGVGAALRDDDPAAHADENQTRGEG